MKTNLEKAKEFLSTKEFTTRSCWECNSGHEHLKNQNGLLKCFSCDKWFINGDSLDNEGHRNSIYLENYNNESNKHK